MKTLVIAISIVFVSISSFSQQTDWEKLDLKDQVKSIETITYVAGDKFGTISKKEILEGKQLFFNKNGLITQEKRYGKAGLPIDQLSYKYDSLNNLIEESIFDKKGLLLRKVLREYNQFNRQTVESIYGKSGDLLTRSVFKYKEGVIPLKVLTFDSNGTQINLKEYFYNKKTKRQAIKYTNPKSKIIERAEKFDLDKNLTDSYKFDVEGKIKSLFQYKYDEDNNLIQSSYFMDNKMLVKRDLIYNNLGFLIEINVKYPEKEKEDTITYTYNFDDKTNWVKQVEYLNSIPVRIKERKIQYY